MVSTRPLIPLIDESIECLYKLLVLLAAASTTIFFPWNSKHSYLVEFRLPVLRNTDLRLRRGLLFHMQVAGLKSDDVSLGIPPAWPGQGLDAIGYLQDS